MVAIERRNAFICFFILASLFPLGATTEAEAFKFLFYDITCILIITGNNRVLSEK